jgi:hypothetical protein
MSQFEFLYAIVMASIRKISSSLTSGTKKDSMMISQKLPQNMVASFTREPSM